jgi:hypothetical protein
MDLIANCTAGLACTILQYGNVCAVLGRLELHPWFVDVLAAGAARLTHPLAAILVPQPPRMQRRNPRAIVTFCRFIVRYGCNHHKVDTAALLHPFV